MHVWQGTQNKQINQQQQRTWVDLSKRNKGGGGDGLRRVPLEPCKDILYGYLKEGGLAAPKGLGLGEAESSNWKVTSPIVGLLSGFIY